MRKIPNITRVNVTMGAEHAKLLKEFGGSAPTDAGTEPNSTPTKLHLRRHEPPAKTNARTAVTDSGISRVLFGHQGLPTHTVDGISESLKF